jgi:hypothetical protein
MESHVSLVSHHRVIIEYRFMIKVFQITHEDDCFSPYKCARLFPSENEWPWSLSEENVPAASLERSDPASCSLSILK